MKQDDLLKRVNALGFTLFGVDEDRDANRTLADVVKSGDLRLWEGFPVVLANSAEKGLFDYDKASRYLKKHVDKTHLAELVVLSLALYKSAALDLVWADEVYRSLSKEEKRKFSGFLERLKSGKDVTVAGRTMSAERLKKIFNDYSSRSRAKLNDLLSAKEELNLEYSLSQVFSPKQKELFLKKLKREKLSKTEREYFSRTVKKKVLALADPELHRLAQKLLQ